MAAGAERPSDHMTVRFHALYDADHPARVLGWLEQAAVDLTEMEP